MDGEFASLRGQLLIASPTLVDPNFFRTVVLVTEHTEEAAMGVVLNRPSTVDVADAVPKLAELAGEGERVYLGGPVQPEAVLTLAEFDDPSESPAIAFENVGFVAGDPDVDLLADATRRARVFAGYAGWGPGQLEAELAESAWIVEPAGPDDVFCEAADGLWSGVLRRKGGAFAVLALMPVDPSLN